LSHRGHKLKCPCCSIQSCVNRIDFHLCACVSVPSLGRTHSHGDCKSTSRRLDESRVVDGQLCVSYSVGESTAGGKWIGRVDYKACDYTRLNNHVEGNGDRRDSRVTCKDHLELNRVRGDVRGVNSVYSQGQSAREGIRRLSKSHEARAPDQRVGPCPALVRVTSIDSRRVSEVSERLRLRGRDANLEGHVGDGLGIQGRQRAHRSVEVDRYSLCRRSSRSRRRLSHRGHKLKCPCCSIQSCVNRIDFHLCACVSVPSLGRTHSHGDCKSTSRRLDESRVVDGQLCVSYSVGESTAGGKWIGRVDYKACDYTRLNNHVEGNGDRRDSRVTCKDHLELNRVRGDVRGVNSVYSQGQSAREGIRRLSKSHEARAPDQRVGPCPALVRVTSIDSRRVSEVSERLRLRGRDANLEGHVGDGLGIQGRQRAHRSVEVDRYSLCRRGCRKSRSLSHRGNKLKCPCCSIQSSVNRIDFYLRAGVSVPSLGRTHSNGDCKSTGRRLDEGRVVDEQLCVSYSVGESTAGGERIGRVDYEACDYTRLNNHVEGNGDRRDSRVTCETHLDLNHVRGDVRGVGSVYSQGQRASEGIRRLSESHEARAPDQRVGPCPALAWITSIDSRGVGEVSERLRLRGRDANLEGHVGQGLCIQRRQRAHWSVKVNRDSLCRRSSCRSRRLSHRGHKLKCPCCSIESSVNRIDFHLCACVSVPSLGRTHSNGDCKSTGRRLDEGRVVDEQLCVSYSVGESTAGGERIGRVDYEACDYTRLNNHVEGNGDRRDSRVTCETHLDLNHVRGDVRGVGSVYSQGQRASEGIRRLSESHEARAPDQRVGPCPALAWITSIDSRGVGEVSERLRLRGRDANLEGHVGQGLCIQRRQRAHWSVKVNRDSLCRRSSCRSRRLSHRGHKLKCPCCSIESSVNRIDFHLRSGVSVPSCSRTNSYSHWLSTSRSLDEGGVVYGQFCVSYSVGESTAGDERIGRVDYEVCDFASDNYIEENRYLCNFREIH